MTLAEFKEGMQYDTHGNITGITRRGNISSGSYGLMDNLTLSYDGKRCYFLTYRLWMVFLPSLMMMENGTGACISRPCRSYIGELLNGDLLPVSLIPDAIGVRWM